MQLLCRFFGVWLVLAPLAGQASDVKIKVDVRLYGWWWPFEPRTAPVVSPHHLSAPPKPAADACTFVAGVRHCPLPPPRGESR